MVINKYSKSSKFYFSTKSDFFENNKKLLALSLQRNKVYTNQPVRKKCKICSHNLHKNIDFNTHGVPYKFCTKCNHLNGNYDDTEEFVRELYISEGGDNYNVADYVDDNFLKRCKDIYLPKIEFLLSSINTINNLSILDVGCGAGYFVYSSLIKNIEATGVDVSKKLVEYGNHQINNLLSKEPLEFHGEESNFYEAITDTSADVISAIGVIEHLRKPELFFQAFKQSKANYLYYSVPMFSLSSIIENCFKELFPRQLSGGHTHLFTEESLKKMNDIIGIKSVAEWRFGVDMLDLYRGIGLILNKNGSSKKLMDIFDSNYLKSIDKMQNSLDESHFCSEIHLIGRKE